MLLIVRNVTNVSADSVVLVSGPAMNWFDLGANIGTMGSAAFGMNLGTGEFPNVIPPITVLPLLTEQQEATSAALARANQLLGEGGTLCSMTWPAGDPALGIPAMKLGLGITTSNWRNETPYPLPPTPWNQEPDGWAGAIFVWIVPPPGRPVTLTRIEVISYDAVVTYDSGLLVAEGQYLFAPNFPVAEDQNAVKKMAIMLSTWALPDAQTTVPFQDRDWAEPWQAFLSNLTREPSVTPAGWEPPLTQTIALPDSIGSRHRDFLYPDPELPPVPIPAAPMILFDLAVGTTAVPTQVGMLDYARSELSFDDSHRMAIEDNFRRGGMMFAWALSYLLGAVEWTEPEIGFAVNMFFTIELPPG
jgi:hypothetical protein